MTKRTTFTSITPLPADVTREAVISFLQDHAQMIDLNPLVTERHTIPPPRHAEPEEHVCTWYSITDRIDYLPGTHGSVTYTAAFHNTPRGLQTHSHAPMGLDIRGRWTVGGNMPGEPPEPQELGVGAPASGLYIREDVDFRCNILLAGFVKKTMKKSHATLVETLTAKARLRQLEASPDEGYADAAGESGQPFVSAGAHQGQPGQGIAAPVPPVRYETPPTRSAGIGIYEMEGSEPTGSHWHAA